MAREAASAALTEKSFSDAICSIATAPDLAPNRRRHWMCSLRVIGKALDRPLELVPARWTAVRQGISKLHHAPINVTSKTLANHRSNVRAALAWFAETDGVPPRGTPLSDEWAVLKEGIAHYRTRVNLSSLMRFCSGRRVTPASVDEALIDEFMAYRAATTACEAGSAARRRVARAWNQCVGTIKGWPDQKLCEPPSKGHAAGPQWEDFPAQLREDVEHYLLALSKIRRSLSGRRYRPCKPSTVRLRRAKLVTFARKAVSLGAPIDQLLSLSELLHPDLVRRVLDAYWQQSGEQPSIYTIELAATLVSIAKETGCLAPADIDCLDDMSASLEAYHPTGLTDKNLALIRQVLSPGVWGTVVSLPEQLLCNARKLRDRAPTKAAVLAQLAVAVGILTFAPVRLGNLGAIRLGESLVRPEGPDKPLWLVFPQHDVKNRIRLEFPLTDQMTALIDEYIGDHLHVLLRGRNDPYLFPGVAGGRKHTATLSAQITKRIYGATGLQVTVHQFRHAAAALILQSHPGNYEMVRRILGHKNVQTTINFYIGLETAEAARMFGEIVSARLTTSMGMA